MDFKGPIGSKFNFLLVIDEYSRIPEVEIVTSTSAEAVIPKCDELAVPVVQIQVSNVPR